MFSNTQLKTAGSAFALVLVVVGLLVGAAGGAAGQTATTTSTATPTATDSGPLELANGTVPVDNDTRSVYADLAAGENSSVTLNVTFSGVDADGNETVLEERTVSLNASETRLVERSDVNVSEYDSYRVTVTAPNTDSTNATAEIGKISKVAGGSGGGLGGAVDQAGGIGVVALLGVGAIVLLRGRDE